MFILWHFQSIVGVGKVGFGVQRTLSGKGTQWGDVGIWKLVSTCQSFKGEDVGPAL